jgi:canavanine-gamma-lyase
MSTAPHVSGARRPGKRDPATLAFATQSVHAGNAVDEGTGTLRTPLVMANSYLLPYDASTMNWSAAAGLVYTRNSGANQVNLQIKLAALEGGEDAVVFATRVAALHGVFGTGRMPGGAWARRPAATPTTAPARPTLTSSSSS